MEGGYEHWFQFVSKRTSAWGLANLTDLKHAAYRLLVPLVGRFNLGIVGDV